MVAYLGPQAVGVLHNATVFTVTSHGLYDVPLIGMSLVWYNSVKTLK